MPGVRGSSLAAAAPGLSNTLGSFLLGWLPRCWVVLSLRALRRVQWGFQVGLPQSPGLPPLQEDGKALSGQARSRARLASSICWTHDRHSSWLASAWTRAGPALLPEWGEALSWGDKGPHFLPGASRGG